MDTRLTIASGCYPRYPSGVVWTGDPPPNYTPMWPPAANPWQAAPCTTQRIPSFDEQMGIDPISKLAAAIEKLAEALREGNRD